MRKSIILLFIGIIALFSFPSYSFAIDVDSAINEKKLENSAEFSDIMAEIVNAESMFDSNGLGKLDHNKAYKAHRLTDPDMIGNYLKNKNLINNISETDCVWQIPSNNGNYATMVKKGNEWITSGMTDLSESKLLFPSRIINIDESVETLNRNQIKSIDSVIYVEAEMYFLAFVLFEKDKSEYIIPQSARPDFTGLENGKIYPADEAIEILIKSFDYDESKIGAEFFADGGAGGIAENNSSDYRPMIFIGIVILLAGASAITVKWYRKKQSTN